MLYKKKKSLKVLLSKIVYFCISFSILKKMIRFANILVDSSLVNGYHKQKNQEKRGHRIL